ncbi:MAG TPA: BrnT family toxin [Bauldia sp.]|nr:BrnT family toxin [Bauldia sp.]
MRIVWDEPKRLANVDKHGFDFAGIDDFGWENALITPTYARRFKAIGLFRDRIIIVIYARLGDEAISIIGMRRASDRERQQYEER